MVAQRGEHQFVAWVGAGLAGAGLSPTGGTVQVAVEGAGAIDVIVATHGPGDVTALDAAAISRLVPPPGTPDFEPNLFAAIELVHPGLPWMLSPERSPRLPWLVLVVVEDHAGVTLSTERTGAVLTIGAPAALTRELPDLSQAWAWAHAHGVGPVGAPIAPTAFEHAADPTFARLLCPRRLEPRRRYHAALVPVFEAGRQAGLGEVPTAAAAALAWTAATPLPLRLPAYRAWSFATGDGGDFASLARSLVARPLPLDAGRRRVAASAPGWGLPDADGRTVAIGGVLRPAATEPTAASPDEVALGNAIGDTIDAAAVTAAGDVPVLAPPLYGAHATGATRIADGPAWAARHNRDVRLRIAAGLGTEVVRRLQDELVDAAWRDLGDAEEANRLVRQAELAAAVGTRLMARYVEPLTDDELVQVTRPAHRRMRLEDAPAGQPPRRTLAAMIGDSVVPTHGVSVAFRRIAGPGGRAIRRLGTAAGEVLDRANRAALQVVPPKELPSGIAALDAISEAEAIQPRFTSARPKAIEEAAVHWKTTPTEQRVALARRRDVHVPLEEVEWTPEPPSTVEVPDPVEIDAFAEASRRHQRYLVEHLGQLPLPTPRRGLGTFATVRSRFIAAAAPRASLVPPLLARFTGHGPTPAGELRPAVIAPTLDRPLVHALRDLGPEHLLPGIDAVPADTVALLAPDHDAVHAFLLGANHEFASELAWRGFPGPPGATPLRTFWGRVVPAASGMVVRDPDIPPIRDWPAVGPGPAPIGLVLLIRGTLVARYPNAIVYLAPARWDRAFRVIADGAPRPSVLQVSLGADTALYGFDLDPTTAVGSPAPPGPAGWYIVIEEHPQDPSFGLGAGPDRPLATWRDLTWGRISAGDLSGGTHLVVDGPLAALLPARPDGLRWGADSAQLATITLRRATRVAIHASLLVRPPAAPPTPPG